MPMMPARHRSLPLEMPTHQLPVLSSSARGYGALWRRLARLFLASHPLCVDPYRRHQERLVAANQVDHITPRRRGGSDDGSNLQALCASCHAYKTARYDGGFGRYRQSGRVPSRG
jgi:5-methylcytosine-specific restriction protein A